LISKVKKYLKNIAKTHSLTETKQIIKKLVEQPDLTETEKWLIYYTYGEGRMVVNTCRKLAISETQYRIIQQMALLKLYYIYLI
jgi:DNA-directed RNA polymerase specialized sigma subunit